MPLRRLGYRSADLVQLSDARDGHLHVFRLQGGADALYQSVKARGIATARTLKNTARESVTGGGADAIQS
jgi:hypothetical protein